MKIDLKYFFAIILSVAGLAATFWYANLPPESKSLTATIISKSALSAVKESELPGLKIFVDDTQLKLPALTVLKIRNDGSTPIRAADYENDIVILFGEAVQPIRANVVNTQPDWLKPLIDLHKSQINLKPIMLNPEDSITINILTNGFPESITARSRIAGLKNVLVADSATTKTSDLLAYLMLGASFILAIPAAGLLGCYKGVRPPLVLHMSRRLWVAATLAVLIPAVWLVMSAVEWLGISTYWKQMMVVYLIMIVSSPFAFWLKRLPPKADVAKEST